MNTAPDESLPSPVSVRPLNWSYWTKVTACAVAGASSASAAIAARQVLRSIGVLPFGGGWRIAILRRRKARHHQGDPRYLRLPGQLSRDQRHRGAPDPYAAVAVDRDVRPAGTAERGALAGHVGGARPPARKQPLGQRRVEASGDRVLDHEAVLR